MTRQTGGVEFGETSTRSSSASRAICRACLMGTTPTLPPSGPISLTSGTRMPSFTRNSVALISFSYFKTVDQHSAGFLRDDNTMKAYESSTKRWVFVGNSQLLLSGRRMTKMMKNKLQKRIGVESSACIFGILMSLLWLYFSNQPFKA